MGRRADMNPAPTGSSIARTAVATRGRSIQWNDWAKVATLNVPRSPGSSSARIIAQRAFAFYNTGDYDQAIRDYTTVLRVRPSWVAILIGRALAYAAAGKVMEAEEDYRNLQRQLLPEISPRA